MEKRIHPTACVDARAELGCDVEIGPFCVVEAGTRIGDRCRLSSHVAVKEGTTLGDDNDISEGATLGGKPQHLARDLKIGLLVIGNGNTIRENVTVHRAMSEDHSTVIGDHNLMMVNAHIAHDCRIGNHAVITNNVMMAGHVEIGDYAYLSGAVGIHQFCRVGCHAMVGGQAHVKKDIPPYVTVDGMTTRVVGLNTIGLRRRGFSKDEINELKAAYRIIYRHGLTWTEVLEALEATYLSGPAAVFHAFLSQGTRGFVSERRTPADATVRLSKIDTDDEPNERRKAG